MYICIPVAARRWMWPRSWQLRESAEIFGFRKAWADGQFSTAKLKTYPHGTWLSGSTEIIPIAEWTSARLSKKYETVRYEYEVCFNKSIRDTLCICICCKIPVVGVYLYDGNRPRRRIEEIRRCSHDILEIPTFHHLHAELGMAVSNRPEMAAKSYVYLESKWPAYFWRCTPQKGLIRNSNQN